MPEVNTQKVINTPSPNIASNSPQTDQVKFNRFGLTRQQLIDGTHFVNTFSAGVLFGGYCSSLVHGVATILGNAAIANAGLHGARIAYNVQTTATSALRYTTTNPSGRTNEDAKSYATASNIASLISVGHGVAITAGRFIPEVFAKINPAIGAFKAYSQTSAFNNTAIPGATAAGLYNKSEYSESEHILGSTIYEIGRQNNVQEGESERAVRANVPHITKSEYWAKNLSYGLGNVAALGGLMSVPDVVIKPHFPKVYEAITKNISTTNLTKATRIGGFVNGVGYAVASLVYPAFVSDNFTSKDRRTSREKGEEWDNIHDKGIIQINLLGAGIATVGLAMALRGKHPNNQIIQKLASFGDKFGGKTDCLAGVAGGTAAVTINTAYNGKIPYVSDLLKDPGQSRRWWAGARMAIANDTLDYIKNTDLGLPPEKVDKYLHDLARKVNSTKNLIPDEELANMPTKEVRKLLEQGRYEKQVVNNRENGNEVVRVMADGDSQDYRLFWPGAHYAASIRSDIEKGKYKEAGTTIASEEAAIRAIELDDPGAPRLPCYWMSKFANCTVDGRSR